MDTKLIVDILKMVGLPGLVIVGWITANLTGAASANNLLLWGLGLLASVVVNFVTTRSKSLTYTLNHTITATLNNTVSPLIEIVHSMAEIDDKILDEVAALKEIYEGGLTTKQLRLVLPKVFDSFKWRVLRICINIATPKGHTVFDRAGVEDTVATQLCSHLEALAEYNHILKQAAIAESVNKSVNHIFDVLYGREFLDLEDYRQRVSVLMEVVMSELDRCSKTVLNLLSGPVTIDELKESQDE